MTDNHASPLAVLPPGSRCPIIATSAQDLHREIRRNASIVAGLEAIALVAFDQGEATPDQVEHIASLATLIRQDLEQLAVALAEVAIAGGRAK
jgi:hypothetical protein